VGSKSKPIDVATYLIDVGEVDVGTYTSTGPVYISDPALFIETLLTPKAINAARAVGLTGITSTNGSVQLSVLQAVTLAAQNIAVTVPNNDTVTISDTEANINTLAISQLDQLQSIGVTAISANDVSSPPISVQTYQSDVAALNNGTFTFTGPVDISDSADQIKSMTPGQINAAGKIGLAGITSTDKVVVLTVAQALVLENQVVPVTAAPNGYVEIADTAAHLKTLTTDQIGALPFIGVSAIAATDAPAVLSADQVNALGNAQVVISTPPNNTSQNDGTYDVPNQSGLGLNLNITWDSSVASAPADFEPTVESAIAVLEATITNNITVNIDIGYGENGGYGGSPGNPTPNNTSVGGPQSDPITYANLRSALATYAITSADATSLNALPNQPSLNGVTKLSVGKAEEKALGFLSPTAPGNDGSIGISDVGFSGTELVGSVLHEITHAMGRINGTTGLALFDYTNAGNHDFQRGWFWASILFFDRWGYHEAGGLWANQRSLRLPQSEFEPAIEQTHAERSLRRGHHRARADAPRPHSA
jgi:hypothetical protein